MQESLMLTEMASTSINAINAKLDNYAEKFLTGSGWVQTGVWLALITALKFPDLVEPPVWDSAMGVFPPAIYLYESSFDIFGLLRESSWWQGGPNVHSLSLLTWFIAIVMVVTQSPVVTFLVVHALTFTAVAWALFLYTRTLFSHRIGPSTVVAAGLVVILMPVVLVQVGYMYEEILVLVFSIAAWDRWRHDKPVAALFYCSIGIFIKLTGVPVALSIMLAIMICPKRWNLRRGLVFALIPAVVFINLSLPAWLGAEPIHEGKWLVTSYYRDAASRLAAVPDLMLVVYLGVAGSVLFCAHLLSNKRLLDFITNPSDENSSIVVCLLMPVVFIAGVIFQVHHEMLLLSRYLVPLIPFAIGSILLYSQLINRQRAALVLFLAIAGFSVINTNGVFYPDNTKSFSVIERSHSYRDVHMLQKDLLNVIENSHDDIPIYVTREIWYMASHPMMGYITREKPDLRPIFRDDYRNRELHEYPDEFMLLLSYGKHGGQTMENIYHLAESSGLYQISKNVFERSGFEAVLLHIKKKEPGNTHHR
jgi:hypothetical protein